MEEVITLRDKKKVLFIPGPNGELPMLVNWVSQIADEYYKAGLTHLSQYPYEGGHTVWVVKVSEKGLIPLVCALHEGWKEVVKRDIESEILVEKGGEKNAYD